MTDDYSQIISYAFKTNEWKKITENTENTEHDVNSVCNFDKEEWDLLNTDTILCITTIQKGFDAFILMSAYDCVGVLQKSHCSRFVGKHYYLDDFLYVFSIINCAVTNQSLLVFHNKDVIMELEHAAQLYNINFSFMKNATCIFIDPDLRVKSVIYNQFLDDICKITCEEPEFFLKALSEVIIHFFMCGRIEYSLW